MKGMLCTLAVAGAVLAIAAPAFAQGGTSSTLAGVVVDNSGGVIPGANVVVKNDATGVSQDSVTNGQGAFSFPGLSVGTYTVTVTLQGFKTYVARNVVLTTGAPASVKAVLEVGGMTEQVTVSSSSEIIQTQSSTVSTTLNTNQITKLPLTSRSAMDFVNLLPGVSTPGGNRNATINGLPQGVINITLDGVNIQDNTLKTSDGFFAIVSPRLDAIEEVTVTTASQGVDASGQGAVQIKFVTRSGTNTFTGSGYHYYRNDALNANTWFNNRNGIEKTDLLQNQAGFRVGGPVVLPGIFDGHNKAFFFVNYEEFHQPGGTTRNRTILNPQAQQGLYSYQTSSGVRSVNVLALAASNGQLSSLDPTVTALLSDIRGATAQAGAITGDIDPNLQRYSFNVDTKSIRRYPTFRFDYNLTGAHRISAAYNYQKFTDFPDTLNNNENRFPGFPVSAGQSSIRKGFSTSLRSTLGRSLVNEGRFGYSGAPVTFFGELTPSMWSGTSVADQKGFQVNFPSIGSQVTAPSAGPSPQARDATSILLEDTVTWLKGSHSISLGGSWTQYTLFARNSNLIPSINFDVVTGDPALSLFTTSNFPGASNANLTAARRLYALLTGRVSSVDGDLRLDEATGQYLYMGTGVQRARMREGGVFLQDAWRLRPNLTVNAGLRYELQYPFYPLNSSYSTATLADLCGVSGVNADTTCNLFQPGVQPGKHPEFVNFGKGTPAYNTDVDNLAPSAGVAWNPARKSGLLGTIMGPEGDFVVRGGYTRAFSRNGLNDFSGVFNANPGVRLASTADRTAALNTLDDGQGLPVLFRQTSRLGPAPFPLTPTYPMTDVVTENINIFDPDIQVPWADTWTAGIQRGLTRNMAIEVRYVGTRSRDNWQTLNYNEINILDNGFVNEFRQAQANLTANIAAGRGNTFAFTGAPGTAPLPILLAYFNGRGASQAGSPASYTGANWSSQTYLAFLARQNPNPFGMVANGDDTGLLDIGTFRSNALAAGLPFNFFVANPDLLGGANLTTNNGRTNYNSLQIELRRRLSQGLQFQGSYVFGKALTSTFETFRRPTFLTRDTGGEGDLTHQLKANVVYDLPFGRGRRFGGNAGGVVERLIGGWQLGLTSIIRSGQLVDFGNVRLVGMARADVENMFKLRFDDAGHTVWMLPQDVIDNTIKAFSVSATSPTGYSNLGVPEGRYFAPANGPDCLEPDNGADYGDCGTRELVVTGPTFQQHDIRISKRTPIVGRVNFEFAAELLNAFNHPNFVPVAGIGNDIANYEVTGLTGTNTARVIQFVTRINW
ncbi:MAG TPA: TonB-dependent receptor [Vicinamibacterales bacterium]|nr:TonB-dependent receptor [Vicinamibacterales bacterium]